MIISNRKNLFTKINIVLLIFLTWKDESGKNYEKFDLCHPTIPDFRPAEFHTYKKLVHPL